MIKNVYDLFHLKNYKREQFLHCKASIIVTDTSIMFYSYRTKMFEITAFEGTYYLKKLSSVDTTTTLLHLQKFFDMCSTSDDYYKFKNLRLNEQMQIVFKIR